MINPEDFIIARKRKKYKFAKFANSKICFEFEDWEKQVADIVELGAGTGLFAVELATLHPQKSFVAVDVKADRLQKGAYEAESRGLKNIQFLRARADQLNELFKDHSVETLWLTFADPFPRPRSSRRRMTHPLYLEKYALVLALDGSLKIKHDSLDFFHWTLEQLVDENWKIEEISFDLQESELVDEYKIMTTYERKWLNEDRQTSFVKAKP